MGGTAGEMRFLQVGAQITAEGVEAAQEVAAQEAVVVLAAAAEAPRPEVRRPDTTRLP
jgi:hypothetical protein